MDSRHEVKGSMAAGVQQSDACRLAQLRSHTARAGHLYRHFTWGNRKSLVVQPAEAGIDVRQRLLSYYKCDLRATVHRKTIRLSYNFFPWDGLLVCPASDVLYGQCVRPERLCREQYSAERMTLAVLGGDSLETLEAWVRDLFSHVPAGKGPKKSFAHLARPYEVSLPFQTPVIGQRVPLPPTNPRRMGSARQSALLLAWSADASRI